MDMQVPSWTEKIARMIFDSAGDISILIVLRTRYEVSQHATKRELTTVDVQYHTKKNDHEFDTSLGEKITNGLQDLSARFHLDTVFGTAPQDYLYLSYVVYRTSYIQYNIPLTHVASPEHPTRRIIPSSLFSLIRSSRSLFK